MASFGGMPGGGHPKGVPLRFGFSRRYNQGRAPTRGAPTVWLLKPVCLEEGTHKGRPYGLASQGGLPRGGHPQGAPLRFGFFRRYTRGRAPTRGAPTVWLLKAVFPGEGTHKGCPYGLASLGGLHGGGNPQGAPLQFGFSRRYVWRRAPTRGAPTGPFGGQYCWLDALLGKIEHGGSPRGALRGRSPCTREAACGRPPR